MSHKKQFLSLRHKQHQNRLLTLQPYLHPTRSTRNRLGNACVGSNPAGREHHQPHFCSFFLSLRPAHPRTFAPFVAATVSAARDGTFTRVVDANAEVSSAATRFFPRIGVAGACSFRRLVSARSRRIYIYIELIIHINATPYVISVTKSVKIPFCVTTSISEVERPRPTPRPCGQESYHRAKAAPPPPEPSLPAQLHFPQQLSLEGERPPHPSNRPGSSPPRVRRARRRSRSPVPGEPRPIARVFSRRERSAWKRRGELTAATPSLPYLPQHHGVQGRIHLLLHLRVRQRGSPRQARGPGARPIDGLLMSLATRAHRPSVADRSIRRPATRRRRDLRIAHRLTDRLPPSSSPPITDLRCRARRVPRRGPRLQGAFNRPFCATVGFRDDV